MQGHVVRRVVPSDNSCLFNAVGYVIDRERTQGPKIRQGIADAVASDPIKYSSVNLGKSNSEYCTWILNPQMQGVYDIWMIGRALYGRMKGYKKRVMLFYDGLHYDALAFSSFEDAPEEFDQTIFEARGGRFIVDIERLACTFVRDERRERNYADPTNFTLRCGICGMGVAGQQGATEHARASNHVDFQGYR